jgi:phage protein D
MGYEGERETISPNARPKPKPKPASAKAGGAKAPPPVTAAERAAKAAAEKAAKEAAEKAAAEKAAKEAAARAEAERKKREITSAHWEAAKKALVFGGRVKLREDDVLQNTSVVINGKVYADGDQISFTHDSRRFTWRVEGLSDKNKLKLVRVRAKYLEKPGEAGKKSDKGVNP